MKQLEEVTLTQVIPNGKYVVVEDLYERYWGDHQVLIGSGEEVISYFKEMYEELEYENLEDLEDIVIQGQEDSYRVFYIN
jgi:hypothetical protein